ncbi:NADH-dependent flavin reductase [compost metagenome]
MGQFATGVTVVTFVADGEPAGMTANAFMSVSLEPPLILISVRNASRFNQWVKEGVCYGVNFLAETQRPLSAHFGGRPEEGLALPYCFHEQTPLLEGSLVQLVHLHIGEQRKPLLFYSGRYHQVHARSPGVEWGGCRDGW